MPSCAPDLRRNSLQDRGFEEAQWHLVHARYQGWNIARFLSPDVAVKRGPLDDPQGWNRYTYGGNNPLTLVDPDGQKEKRPSARESLLRSVWRWVTGAGSSSGGTGGLDPQNREAAGEIGALHTRSAANMRGFGQQANEELAESGARGTEMIVQGAEMVATLQIARDLNVGIHALKRMSERGVSLGMIKTTLRKGIKFWDPKNKVVVSVLEGGMASGKSLLVGQNPVTGKITTVIVGRKLLSKRFIPIVD